VGEIHEALQRELTLPLLDTPEEACGPDAEMFDTPYHLTGAGMRRYSTHVANRLAEHLAQPGR
jgi:hypothetical protein